jgi:uncharacterized protein YdiU (UPF0061 family)
VKSKAFPAIYELGPAFYDEVSAASFPKPQLRYRNQEAAKSLGLDELTPDEWQKHFSEFQSLPQNINQPLALRYHGHQFQSYNPDLGDGRGFLFAQFMSNGKLMDLGTKGSGQTPYSRRGDGRLTLKGAFREILATEMLESLGVNTSKTFSVFETGESLERHDEPSPTRGGVLVRLNHSHVRYGTFQRLAFLGEAENLQKLIDYCVRHFYPELGPYAKDEQIFLFLKKVSEQAAKTAAGWMMGGFVHGVLNTDNMNITGESFDYGPFRFLPTYDPHFTAAYFDNSGLYAYGRQPTTVLWNLSQLGKALQLASPNIDVNEALADFGDDFNFAVQERLLARLNLRNPLQDEVGAQALTQDLIIHLFKFLEQTKALFEQTFFDLHSGISKERLLRSPQAELYQHASFPALQETLERFEVLDSTKQQHPYFKGTQACSMLIDELESIWLPIAERDDWTLFEHKLQAIRGFRGIY